MFNWVISLKDAKPISYDGDISDILPKYKDMVNNITLYKNANFVCKNKIDPNIPMILHNFDRNIIDHFWYLDKIIVRVASYNDNIESLPDNVIIHEMTVSYIKPISCKLRCLKFSNYDHARTIQACENSQLKMTVGSCDLENIANDIVQDVIECFEHIKYLSISSDQVQYLDANRFSNINIESIIINYVRDSDISIVLANRYVKQLALYGSTRYELNGSNDSLEKISIPNKDTSLLNKYAIEKWVNKNQENNYNSRFARVKAIMPIPE